MYKKVKVTYNLKQTEYFVEGIILCSNPFFKNNTDIKL